MCPTSFPKSSGFSYNYTWCNAITSLSLSLSLSSTASYYVKVMKKVMEKGAEYIKNESERLGRILSELPWQQGCVDRDVVLHGC
jgi:hypothetical protein